MKPLRTLFTLFCFSLFALLAVPGHADNSGNAGYDPAANAQAALATALAQAKAENKRVLIVAGGDWCRWCLILNTFWDNNPDTKAERDQAFVLLKVYVGDQNPNKEFFAKLPKAKGYPHFWVLGADGKVIQSVNTGGLENGKNSYDKEKVSAFIKEMGKAL